MPVLGPLLLEKDLELFLVKEPTSSDVMPGPSNGFDKGVFAGWKDGTLKEGFFLLFSSPWMMLGGLVLAVVKRCLFYLDDFSFLGVKKKFETRRRKGYLSS